MSDIKFNTIEEAIADFKAGKMVIAVDDDDLENEGSLLVAGEFATPEVINFMATNAKGLCQFLKKWQDSLAQKP